MNRKKVAIAVKERMEELALERGTTLHAVLREMQSNPLIETKGSSISSPGVEFVCHYCARMGISLQEFFEDDRFR